MTQGIVDDGPPGQPPVTTGTPEAHGGRFIKIAVPNFTGNADETRGLTSYLRIGATEADLGVHPGTQNTPNAAGIDTTGEDLAALVQGFADDTRIRTLHDGAETLAPFNASPALLPLGAVTAVLDGTTTPLPPAETLPPGLTPPVPAGSALDPANLTTGRFDGTLNNRLAESSQLHTKGGWRDHSDGNRITTTWGDKVEVIRGNYRMLVLGRRDDTQQVTGWDMSGGLVDTDGDDLDSGKSTTTAHDLNNIYNVEYRWEADSNGRWGWTQTTVTGNHDTLLDPPNDPPGNGKQTSITWVDEMKAFVGGPPLAVGSPQASNPVYAPAVPASPFTATDGVDPAGNKRVNFIFNRTWVNVLDEATDTSGSITELITCGADMTETTTVTGNHDITTSTGETRPRATT